MLIRAAVAAAAARLRLVWTASPAPHGQHGPLPFQDPWWKVLLLVLAAILLLLGTLSEGSDVAYHGEDLVIGALDRYQLDDIDAAIAVLDGSRTVPSPAMQVLDAQADEINTTPVSALGGILTLTGPPLDKDEVRAILLLP